MRVPHTLSVLVLVGLASAGPAATACGACGCTLHSDWSSQGLTEGQGLRMDMRFDYFDQDQLRLGRRAVDRGSLSLPNDQEVQQQTINRNLTLGFDYSPNANWGFNLQVPLFDRTHETIAPGDMEVSSSRSAGIGDVRVMGRYQGFNENRSFGVQLGLKLPTGRSNDTFNGGPQAGGPLDRGLQLGTGTTDLLFGVYAFGDLAENWGYFTQAMVQVPLRAKDGFRPGNGLNLNAGVRYMASLTVVPQLQVNVRAEKPETGINADTQNSGATLAYLSPGATFRLNSKLHLSVFVQVPIYERVSGYQLEPRFLSSVGLHYVF